MGMDLNTHNSSIVAAGVIVAAVVQVTSPVRAQQWTAEDLAQRGADRVAAQIKSATTPVEGATWATQPGAISVFTDSAKPDSIYKLYSSASPRVSGQTDLSLDVPADWNTNTARYVDLNAPAPTGSGIRFPIADPRADAEGFSYKTTIAGAVPPGSDDARLPMPVMWLYVLADGNEGYLDRNNRFVGSVIPTRDNPIVGRYAFWADDNTSRININRASEGVYWDTPRVDTLEDRSYAEFQPATGEYQRYPGHPARVSMSSVLYPGKRYHLPGTTSTMGSLTLEETKSIWQAARGISLDGGSVGGTRTISESDDPIEISPEFEPYDSAGDLALDLPPDASQRAQRGTFFLATDTRSDDTNLHGYPRTSVWPVATLAVRRTPFDRAVADVSTVSRRGYLFQRLDAYSLHQEFYNTAPANNNTSFQYLQHMMRRGIPGIGASFASKYGAGRFDDTDHLLAQSLEHVRGTNIFDGTNRRWQYTKGGRTRNFDRAVGHGQITPMCLCGGSSIHRDVWHDLAIPTPKPAGRMIGISEFALMFVLRAETKLPDPGTGEVAFIGDIDDLRDFGLWDFGQPIPNKKLVQLGILVEAFAPCPRLDIVAAAGRHLDRGRHRQFG